MKSEEDFSFLREKVKSENSIRLIASLLHTIRVMKVFVGTLYFQIVGEPYILLYEIALIINFLLLLKSSVVSKILLLFKKKKEKN